MAVRGGMYVQFKINRSKRLPHVAMPYHVTSRSKGVHTTYILDLSRTVDVLVCMGT